MTFSFSFSFSFVVSYWSIALSCIAFVTQISSVSSQCDSSEFELSISVEFDQWAWWGKPRYFLYETQFYNTLAEGSYLWPSTGYSDTVCLDAGCYAFVLNEDRNGIESYSPNKGFQLALDGELITLGRQTMDYNQTWVFFCTDMFESSSSLSSLQLDFETVSTSFNFEVYTLNDDGSSTPVYYTYYEPVDHSCDWDQYTYTYTYTTTYTYSYTWYGWGPYFRYYSYPNYYYYDIYDQTGPCDEIQTYTLFLSSDVCYQIDIYNIFEEDTTYASTDILVDGELISSLTTSDAYINIGDCALLTTTTSAPTQMPVPDPTSVPTEITPAPTSAPVTDFDVDELQLLYNMNDSYISDTQIVGCADPGCNVFANWRVEGFCQSLHLSLSIIELDYDHVGNYLSVLVNQNFLGVCLGVSHECSRVWRTCENVQDSDITNYVGTSGLVSVELLIDDNTAFCTHEADNSSYYLYAEVTLSCLVEPFDPTTFPSLEPTYVPTESTENPTRQPTVLPSDLPTILPSETPSSEPTTVPTEITSGPTSEPTKIPSNEPTGDPTDSPTDRPTGAPTDPPTDVPSDPPTGAPTGAPSDEAAGGSGAGSTGTKNDEGAEGINSTLMTMIILGGIFLALLCVFMIAAYVKHSKASRARARARQQEDVRPPGAIVVTSGGGTRGGAGGGPDGPVVTGAAGRFDRIGSIESFGSAGSGAASPVHPASAPGSEPGSGNASDASGDEATGADVGFDVAAAATTNTAGAGAGSPTVGSVSGVEMVMQGDVARIELPPAPVVKVTNPQAPGEFED